MKKTIHLILVISTFILCWTACTKEDSPPLDSKVPITLKGKIIDEQGTALSGVQLSLSNSSSSTISDANGQFDFSTTALPQERAILKANLANYMSGSFSFEVEANQSYSTTLVLGQADANQTISVTTGGTINLPSGAKVALPANGVSLMDGSPYNGNNIQVQVKEINSDLGVTFSAQIPGNTLSAIDVNGNERELVSFGMLRVELSGDNGQPLQLTTGNTSTLTFSIPNDQQSTAPNSIPLWYFDEAAGLWKEEGMATKQGATYVGTVSHFTTWNCDQPHPPCFISGCVTDSLGIPLAGIPLIVGQTQVYTDDGGCFNVLIPAQFLPIIIYSIDYNLLQTCFLYNLTAVISPNTTYNIGTVICNATNTANWNINIPDTVVGNLGATLTVPIHIKDSLNQNIPNTTVTATVISGGGTLINNQVTTNASGIALIEWNSTNSGVQEIMLSIGAINKTVIGKHISITTGSMTDSRDNETYATVTIAGQTWLAENLRYDVPAVYTDTLDISNPNLKYGRIYDWATIMNGSPSSNNVPSAVRGICPLGWHLPSDAEFNILEVNLGLDPANLISHGTRGGHYAPSMKSTTGWYNNENGTNSSLFNVLPAPYGFPANNNGTLTAIWTATASFNGGSLARYFYHNKNGVHKGSNITNDRLSCRCIQD
ncbi:FISUMP domain-containing protein [Aureispira anguillae]|uniref:Fibrobacter succinogenes major paralogous domain-containing protein n=1 Tax=Aureispira anguillae TaxID=2864201 RepID=A0A915YF65_9BACT|nr:FISUMP domain-containing protein [Aureispira anguillae]BDS11883.1 hypothetical protein AsAng_0025970 [Aureispira anguillae]